MSHAASHGAGRFAFLGDFVGYGAEPGWVVDFVADHVRRGAAVAVMGNHDSAVVRGPAPTMVAQARAVVAWTRSQLDPAQIAFLAALPLSITEEDRLYVHANAFAPMDWVYVITRIEAI